MLSGRKTYFLQLDNQRPSNVKRLARMAHAIVTPAQVRAAIQERAETLAARTIREEHVVEAVNALLLRARRYPTTLALACIVDELPHMLGAHAAYLAYSNDEMVDIVRARFGDVHTVRAALVQDPWEPHGTVKITFSDLDADADADADVLSTNTSTGKAARKMSTKRARPEGSEAS